MADPLPVLVFLVLALIGAELTLVFVNSLLPEVGPHEELGRISGSGWAFGYWGGLVALVIVLGLMTPAPGSENTILGIAPILGLDPAQGEGARATGPFSVLWYVVFMVPFFLWSPDVSRRRSGAAGAVAEGLRSLKATLAGLPSRPSLLAYLLASMFYRRRHIGDRDLRRHLCYRRARMGNVRARPLRSRHPDYRRAGRLGRRLAGQCAEGRSR